MLNTELDYNEKKVDNSMFAVKLPKYLLNRVQWYVERFNMSLIDSLRSACCDVCHSKNTLWYKAWYYEDYREILPSAYIEEYLDFEKYPLKYKEV